MGCFQSKADKEPAPGTDANSHGQRPTLLTSTAASSGGKDTTSEQPSGASSGEPSSGIQERSGVVPAEPATGPSWTTALGSWACCQNPSVGTDEVCANARDAGIEQEEPLVRVCSQGSDQVVSKDILGLLVKKVLGNFDPKALGVQIHIGALHLDPVSGRLEAQDLKVDNPTGYTSPYLLRADRASVLMNPTSLLASLRDGDVEAKELVFEGVEVIYEKSLASSNLTDLLESMSKASKLPSSARAIASDEDLKLTLHKVLADDVGAPSGLEVSGLRLSLGKMGFDDFAKEIGAKQTLADVIRALLTKLIKGVLAMSQEAKDMKKQKTATSGTASSSLFRRAVS